MKITKLKIQFAEETRFGVPTRQIFRTWKQLLSGTRLSIHFAGHGKTPNDGQTRDCNTG